MKPEEIQSVVSQWYRHIGSKAGKSRSDAKRKAARENAAKARAKRVELRRKGLGK